MLCALRCCFGGNWSSLTCRYRGGFNPAATWGFIAGVTPNVPGFLKTAGLLTEGPLRDALCPPALDIVYSYAWFVGFFVGGGVYYVAMMMSRAAAEAAEAAEA